MKKNKDRKADIEIIKKVFNWNDYHPNIVKVKFNKMLWFYEIEISPANPKKENYIEWFAQKSRKIDHVCCVYATAPFIQAKYLIKGYEKLIDSGSTFAFSVTSFPFPVQRAIRIKGGTVEAMYPEYIYFRSQDIEEAFHDAGQFYWGTVDGFIDDMDMFSSISVPIRLSRQLVQDIDTVEDWQRAELMYKAWELANQESSESLD